MKLRIITGEDAVKTELERVVRRAELRELCEAEELKDDPDWDQYSKWLDELEELGIDE